MRMQLVDLASLKGAAKMRMQQRAQETRRWKAWQAAEVRKQGRIRGASSSVREVRAQGGTPTAAHLADGCSIREWLRSTGLKSQPGPPAIRTQPWATVQLGDEGEDLSKYHQVGGGSGISGSGAARAASR